MDNEWLTAGSDIRRSVADSQERVMQLVSILIDSAWLHWLRFYLLTSLPPWIYVMLILEGLIHRTLIHQFKAPAGNVLSFTFVQNFMKARCFVFAFREVTMSRPLQHHHTPSPHTNTTFSMYVSSH